VTRFRRWLCYLFGHRSQRRRAWVDEMCGCRVSFCPRCQTLWVDALRQGDAVEVSYCTDERGRVVGMPVVVLRSKL